MVSGHQIRYARGFSGHSELHTGVRPLKLLAVCQRDECFTAFISVYCKIKVYALLSVSLTITNRVISLSVHRGFQKKAEVNVHTFYFRSTFLRCIGVRCLYMGIQFQNTISICKDAPVGKISIPKETLFCPKAYIRCTGCDQLFYFNSLFRNVISISKYRNSTSLFRNMFPLKRNHSSTGSSLKRPQ